ncbi:alpha-ketoglutarate-dependent dioxygenase AlkB family protein [Maribacter sp. MAR_2009_72]|uniref:alpha-ketoglutarate-dependent dioxygenase AlkB family protein n=1 Tax=Maribacter sp. MAR_2009_72 TaxID=1250050 RepID=UPI00119925AB|nr:alpha-ketoglutarate-dependent dioxygenase AlkB [Maribacter sp. MAR_2009_72]TVZ15090.1 alkylated DNA repair dioxygenase AlkB [Maribacter sp. MAR_2009_72]
MQSLFDDSIELNLPDSDICYIPRFLDRSRASHFFDVLKNNTPWQQDNITVFGKTYPQPRLTALYANNDKPYSYSNITMLPLPFNKELLEIKDRLETFAKVEFTTCLLNRYRTGSDSNGWHADNEKELGENPIIASISLGAARFFHLKHNTRPDIKHKINLQHGSLLLMKGKTQHYYKHQIAKTAKAVEERINLTFRIIK